MHITTLSTKGQVVIPKELRQARAWEVGVALEVVEMPVGLLLRPAYRPLFPTTQLADVLGSAGYAGPPLDAQALRRALAGEVFGVGPIEEGTVAPAQPPEPLPE